MEFIRGLHNLRPRHRGCVVAIGNFDGVHLGHQAILARLAEVARSMALPSTVIVFEPQPQEYFTPQQAPARLMTLRDKLDAFAACGVSRTLCLRFDSVFSGLSAPSFIQSILVEGLAARHVLVGVDFRYGKGRAGDFSLLAAEGGRQGYVAESIAAIECDGQRVSSTRVRAALDSGDFAQAGRLLGRPYLMQGRVMHGDQRGRSIGFPTANLALRRRKSPLTGVFAVETKTRAGVCQGVANIGTRPTVCGLRALLEVHLFDCDATLYGQRIAVEFLRKLRDERRFESFDALRAQIECDALAAREYFAMRMPPASRVAKH
jgi:riboflavin kinase/FMN adenylyltransferase